VRFLALRAGLPWRDALTLPLADALDVADAQHDQEEIEKHRHDERMWASLAPYSKDSTQPPEPPKQDD
jgi:hypothetical protein